jgi:hypothetical protein
MSLYTNLKRIHGRSPLDLSEEGQMVWDLAHETFTPGSLWMRRHLVMLQGLWTWPWAIGRVLELAAISTDPSLIRIQVGLEPAGWFLEPEPFLVTASATKKMQILARKLEQDNRERKLRELNNPPILITTNRWRPIWPMDGFVLSENIQPLTDKPVRGYNWLDVELARRANMWR